MIVLLILSWAAIGWSGFVYWWTRDFDYTSAQVPVSLSVAILGPLAWALGAVVHGEVCPPRPLIRKRGRPHEQDD